jgi:hypothetical protein
MIRDYTEDDRPAIEACFRELQQFERGLDSNRVAAS